MQCLPSPEHNPGGIRAHTDDGAPQCRYVSFLDTYSRQSILVLTLEWFRELSFSRLECGVHDMLLVYPLCGMFYFPWYRHRIEGTNGLQCLIRMTQAMWGKRTCPCFEAALQPPSYHAPQQVHCP